MKELTVVKDNKLIDASYRLSLTEQRMVLYCISQMDSKNSRYSKKDEFTINVKDFKNFFNVKGSDIYRSLKEAEENLFNRRFHYKNPETGRWRKSRWISAVEYDGEEGLSIQFSPDVLPFLTELKGNFTQYRLEDVAALSSAHAVRIYELCLSLKGRRENEVGLDDLKKMLGIEKKYERFKDLNKWVIKPSVEQVNNNTDLTIQIEPIRKSRRIVALKFTIKSKSKSHHKASNQKTNSTIKSLRQSLEENIQ